MKEKIANRFMDSNIQWSQYEGNDFLIFDSWDEVKEVESFIKSVDEDEDLDSIFDWNWGFSDEYSTCSDCYTVIRTSPDCYGWQPDFDIVDGGIYCSDCIDPDEYLESRINQSKLVNDYLVDPSDNGWEAIDLDFENGLHRGQNSDPSAIIALLNPLGIDVLFTGDVGQFDVRFIVWVRTSHLDSILHVATGALTEGNTDLPYDQATEMSKVLQGKHSDHYHMETHTISREDFIEGNLPK